MNRVTGLGKLNRIADQLEQNLLQAFFIKLKFVISDTRISILDLYIFNFALRSKHLDNFSYSLIYILLRKTRLKLVRFNQGSFKHVVEVKTEQLTGL